MLTPSAFGVSKEVMACASQDGDYLGQVPGTTAAWCLWTRDCSPPRWARWIRNLCRFKKNLHLAVEGGWPLPARDLRPCLRWRSAETFRPLWAIVQPWQCYFGIYWWMVGLSRLYCRRRPDCQQDLHDTGWGGKHKAKTLRELDCIPRHCAITNQKNYWDTQLDGYYIIWSSGMFRFLNNSYHYWSTPKRSIEPQRGVVYFLCGVLCEAWLIPKVPAHCIAHR